jgi:processive 1,2-diacylglycerol beta-glucosyltransferase
MLDLLVVHCPVGGGHKAAASALVEAAVRRGLSARLVDLFALAPRLVGDAYVTTHLEWTSRAPESYGEAYFGSNRRGGTFEPLRLTWDRIVFSALLREVERSAPRAIVATHHLPLVVLGRARRKALLAAPVTGVVTDYTAHAVWAERGVDRFCVASRLPEEELVSHGVAAARIVRTGIPVREAFEALPAPRSAGPMRVLCTSGGFGVGPLADVVRSFAGVPDVELTVVCGKSDSLVAATRAVAAECGVRANVLGFESDMPARVAQADVVVGKAGGLTVSETLTSGRPMVVVGAIPGNEMLNEAFVVGGGAGIASAARDVGARVAALRAHGALALMSERAQLLVRSHASANVLGVAMGAIAETTRAA